MSKKKLIGIFLSIVLLLSNVIPVFANTPFVITATAEEKVDKESATNTKKEDQGNAVTIEAPYAVLMDASTGTIIFEKEKDTKRSPASITKIMTLILIFDELEKGNIKMTDEVITSAHAKSMGGSQVFLEEGEKQTVETMIKCIVIASGNDASVAMAEHIAGSEEEFVGRMNERAKGLGMSNSNFEDCCGLTESSNHYTTAHDVAIMSRELITKYPKILEYSGVWMEDIVHTTNKGSSNFTLTNTNKLIRGYEGCVGLKTGSTSIAKYCVSAVAKRNNLTLISVVMAAPDYKVRFADAAKMLNYGFGKCKFYLDENKDPLPAQKVKHSVINKVECGYKDKFQYIDTNGTDLDGVEKEIKFKKNLQAPIKKGDVVGTASYFLGDKLLGTVDVVANTNIERSKFVDYLKDCLYEVFL